MLWHIHMMPCMANVWTCFGAVQGPAYMQAVLLPLAYCIEGELWYVDMFCFQAQLVTRHPSSCRLHLQQFTCEVQQGVQLLLTGYTKRLSISSSSWVSEIQCLCLHSCCQQSFGCFHYHSWNTVYKKVIWHWQQPPPAASCW